MEGGGSDPLPPGLPMFLDFPLAPQTKEFFPAGCVVRGVHPPPPPGWGVDSLHQVFPCSPELGPFARSPGGRGERGGQWQLFSNPLLNLNPCPRDPKGREVGYTSKGSEEMPFCPTRWVFQGMGNIWV